MVEESLAATDHSRERAHLDTREREMGPLRGVGPVAGRISHINARRAMAKKESQAGYDLCVDYRQWSQRSRWKTICFKYFVKREQRMLLTLPKQEMGSKHFTRSFQM